ncbi:TPA: hypothetical protein NJ528_003355 [Vibrio parahaemolyticus]|uniref:hypothetical protein n=1 Tax=Vibrio TaxID=662 RepID=UPI001BD41EEA|nr:MULTISPECIES: hypothetical protein [Vibrio]HCG8289264.1 hypothetical protein [Vibrio parahaemolyticus]MBT0025394.1 hypothetical protein [Vibrio alginolyticus]MCS0168067.1 hypothetical protein [Vibrio alginolyticus]MDW1628481.1 hypothetical protein [Vibrio sp. Y176]HCG8294454.1 hypothetical protein [Vibrio parahaemolyticus]
MKDLMTSDWLAIAGIIVAVFGVVVALVIGVIQIKKKNDAITINQKQGSLSRGKQTITINKDS